MTHSRIWLATAIAYGALTLGCNNENLGGSGSGGRRVVQPTGAGVGGSVGAGGSVAAGGSVGAGGDGPGGSIGAGGDAIGAGGSIGAGGDAIGAGGFATGGAPGTGGFDGAGQSGQGFGGIGPGGSGGLGAGGSGSGGRFGGTGGCFSITVTPPIFNIFDAPTDTPICDPAFAIVGQLNNTVSDAQATECNPSLWGCPPATDGGTAPCSFALEALDGNTAGATVDVSAPGYKHIQVSGIVGGEAQCGAPLVTATHLDLFLTPLPPDAGASNAPP